MSCSIKIMPERNIMITTASGEFDEKAYMTIRTQLSESVKKADTQHVLLDLRTADVHTSLADVLRVGVSNMEFISSNSKFAVVFSSEIQPETDAEFGDTAAQNRGIQFKIFTDMTEAREWLCKSGTVSEGT